MRISQTFYDIQHHIPQVSSKIYYLGDSSPGLRGTLLPNNHSLNITLPWLKPMTLGSNINNWIRFWPSHLKTNYCPVRVGQIFYDIRHHVLLANSKSHHLNDLSLGLRETSLHLNNPSLTWHSIHRTKSLTLGSNINC